MKLLALDTASAQCSVALVMGEELIVREAATARDHAQLILPMVDEVLAQAGVKLAQLDGIAFGRGPGSFTGVRVAAAVTQGLAAGAGLPVLPVSDLRALAAQALRLARGMGMSVAAGRVLACMDARMGEVYWAMFEAAGGEILRGAAEQVTAPQVLLTAEGSICVAAAGKGLAAWPQIAVSLHVAAGLTFAGAEPHACDIAMLATQDLANGASWLDAALAQPVYLRDQVAKSSFQPPL
jgi:tRNA threonylcarbamoyladenosine biosynthesis protein TsaB